MSTKLFVGNLSYAITEQELRDAFAQGGRTVQTVRIARDRETNRPRGFAFVEVATDAEADSVINEWNNKLLAGRPIFVEKAQERAPGERPPPRPRVPGAGPPGGGGYGSDAGGPRPGGPRPPPRTFGGPSFDPTPAREGGRRHNTKPDRKIKEKKPVGRPAPEERERGKWRWDGNDDY
ncbi:MAG TPA: RNA-binding protein [Pseudomonadota bacterium]|mgnify:CR=1 FL=1|jgi:RNA recognition motif-containing protein|nr:RNA-binding protein [Pseudomonadota bacterium]